MNRLASEIYRLKTPLLILVVSSWYWGAAEAWKTLTLLGVFLSAAWILAHVAGKELLGKYGWDVGDRLHDAWDQPYLSRSILAVGMLAARVIIFAVILFAIVFLAGTLLRGQAFAEEIICQKCHKGKSAIPPRAFENWQVLQTEHARIWPESDITIFAGQIQTESNWRMTATRREASGVTSYGGLQVLDVTWNDLKKKHSTLLEGGPAQMLQARWGIRAGLLYDKQMWGLCSFAETEDDRYRFMLAAYNGGYGWILRDRKLTLHNGKDQNIWANNVALYSERARQNFKINREYPIKIFRYAEQYRGIGL